MAATIEPTELRAAAHHEAGHAIVAAAVGLDVYAIWIDDEGLGEVRHKGHVSEGAELAVAIAGTCAESILCGDDRDSVRELLKNVLWALEEGEDAMPCDAVDMAHALRKCHSDGQMEERLQRARDFARNVLSSEWVDVQVIAGCIGGDA